MIPLIQKALMTGYSAFEILNHLSKKYKGMEKAIKQAKSFGYGDNDILNFFGKTQGPKYDKQLSEKEQYLKGAGLLNKEEKDERKNRYLGGALRGVAAAYAAYQGYKHFGQPSKGTVEVLGPEEEQFQLPEPKEQQLLPYNPGSPDQPPPSSMPVNPMSGDTPGMQIDKGIQAPGQVPTPPMQPPQQQQDLSAIGGIGGGISDAYYSQAFNALKAGKTQIATGIKEPFLEFAMNDFKQGKINSPDDLRKLRQIYDSKKQTTQHPVQQAPPQKKETFIQKAFKDAPVESLPKDLQSEARFLGTTLHKMEQEGIPWEDPRVKKIRDRINGLTKGKQGIAEQERARFKEQYPEQPPQKEQQQPFAPPVSKQTLAKGSRALTPSGDIAEIEDLPGKTAKINIDGKRSVMESDDLTPIPDNADEIAHHYQRIMELTPKQFKSNAADALLYNEEDNELQVLFHGESYIFDDVPEELASAIKNSEFMAKTSGKGIVGPWWVNEPSIGAGVSKFVQEAKARAKAKAQESGNNEREYSKKFKTLYNITDYAKNAYTEKLNKQKQSDKEEKARKKLEENLEKQRKKNEEKERKKRKA